MCWKEFLKLTISKLALAALILMPFILGNYKTKATY